MIITCKKNTPQVEIEKIIDTFESKGLQVNLITGENYNVYGIVGDTTVIDDQRLTRNPWVVNVTRVAAPYKKVNRLFHPEDSIIDVGGIKVGGNEKIVVIGGPCSVEGLDHICDLAEDVKNAGGCMLRGGAYKPRTSPYAFQGLGTEGILDMVEAKKRTGLPIVSEIMSADKIDEFVEHVDLIQVGARNMQNFELLKALGKINKPILLKRGLCNTINEWLMAAEYILAGGNTKVILCERGIRTYETYTRNTLDLSAVLAVKELSHLPVIVDPSHSTGRWSMVEAMSKAALACGADGIIVEVHNNPECALCDGAQSLKPKKFDRMMGQLKLIAPIVGKKI